MYKNFKMDEVDLVTSRLMSLDTSDLDPRCDEIRSIASTSSLATVESYNSSSTKDDNSLSPRSYTSATSFLHSEGESSGNNNHSENTSRPQSRQDPEGHVTVTQHSRQGMGPVDHHYTNSNSRIQTNPEKTYEHKQTIKYGHLSNEHARLSEVLDNLLPEQVVNVIRSQLERRDSKIVVALGILFPRQQFPPLERAHCVRCHMTFNPHEDTNCLVPHPSNAVVKVAQDNEGANFLCRLCQHSFRLKHADFYDGSHRFYMSGFCFKGKHTAMPDDVAYGGAIHTCQQQGCVEVFL